MQNKIKQRILIEKFDCEKIVEFIGDKESQEELDMHDILLLERQLKKYDQTHKENMKRIRAIV
jgi:hypothetical protein